jgi:hypothetical protein
MRQISNGNISTTSNAASNPNTAPHVRTEVRTSRVPQWTSLTNSRPANVIGRNNARLSMKSLVMMVSCGVCAANLSSGYRAYACCLQAAIGVAAMRFCNLSIGRAMQKTSGMARKWDSFDVAKQQSG